MRALLADYRLLQVHADLSFVSKDLATAEQELVLETLAIPLAHSGWVVGNWEVDFWFARDTLSDRAAALAGPPKS